ncbi:MAG: NAD(P)H-binding protein [Chloroflexi bacterium]|nr:NAD(P)H-binding protein [Chloroflexota bacterium]MDA1226551.1 NAD(P)H-binding protein [Chloroflexota bacterium]
MPSDDFSIVTGAFSYTGKYIANELLRRGVPVKTLTGHPKRDDPFQGQVQAMPYDFDDPARLAKSLEGASVLYNTYWVRFAKGQVSHATAVRNTRTLVKAARAAGIRRIVQISVTNPSLDSPLPYFKGKALQEQAVMNSGLSYGIVRPALIFGKEDILLNNIAWSLRNFRIFPIFGTGQYRVQPAHAGDVAELAVSIGQGTGDSVVDAIGPDIMKEKTAPWIMAPTMRYCQVMSPDKITSPMTSDSTAKRN